jgi:transposase
MKPSIETLKHLYEVERLTQEEIAQQFGVHQATIGGWMKDYGIKRLPKSSLAKVIRQTFQPKKAQLEELYLAKRMTTRQIGSMFDVSKTEVRRWLIEYDISIRPARRGLLNLGIQEPTKEQLYHLVHEKHLSYREIGEMFSVTGSAVYHWLIRHNMPHAAIWDTRYKGNNPIMPEKEELAGLYESGMSLDLIGDIFGVSGSRISKLCNEYGIQVKPDGWNNGQRYLCQDGHMVRSVYEQRVDNWLFAHNIPHVYEPPLPCDKRFKADFFANGWYIEIWGVANDPKYQHRRKHKCQLYAQHQYPLIEFGLGFFDQRSQNRLENRLTKILQTPLAIFPPSD